MIGCALKSKTIWFAIFIAVFGAVLATLPLLRESIPKEIYGYIFMIISIMVAVLRVVTTLPLKDK